MSNRIFGVYELYYPTYGQVQYKNLISHNDFLNDIKPSETKIMELTTELNEINQKKHPDRVTEIKKEIKSIKNRISEDYGNYFTDQSPLWKSLENGGICVLPSWQSGEIKVRIRKMVNFEIKK